MPAAEGLSTYLKFQGQHGSLLQRSKTSAFIKIYWTLNVLTKDSITKTWWGTTSGCSSRKRFAVGLHSQI